MEHIQAHTGITVKIHDSVSGSQVQCFLMFSSSLGAVSFSNSNNVRKETNTVRKS